MGLYLEWAWGHEKRTDAGLWLCIYASVGVIGIFANLLVLVVFLRGSSGSRNVTAKLIIHQSVIDLISSIVFLPFYIIPEGWFIKNEEAGDAFCQARTTFWVLATSSTTNLVLITIERYYAIVYPIKHYVNFKNGKFCQFLPIVYVYGFLGMGHLVFVAKMNDEYYCCYHWNKPNVQVVVGILSFTFTWLIPTSIIIYAYANILVTLRKMHCGFPDGSAAGSHCGRRRYVAQKNLINTFIAVSVAYAVCWTPDMFLYLTFNVTAGEKPKNMEDGIGHRLTVLLSVCNMVVNPFIYAFKYRDFKTGLSKMFSDIKTTSRANGT